MKNSSIIIFLSVFFTIYTLVHSYVFFRGLKALEATNFVTPFKWIFWLIAFTFVIGQFLERGEPTFYAKIITHIGSVWAGFFVYLLLFTLFVDIIRVVNYFIPFIPNKIHSVYSNGQILFVLGLSLAFITTSYGYINARIPKIHEVKVKLNKKLSRDYKIVLLSDIHIGAIIGKNRVEEMVQKINAQNPDMVLFAGDLVDHNPRYLIRSGAGEDFAKINAPLGVFAVTGNHEYISNPYPSIEYLSKYGVKFLRDTVVIINNDLQLIGRDDISKNRSKDAPRTDLSKLVSGLENSKAILMMDHQPFKYAEAQQLGVDLMMSGHTHKGQLWPFNYITSMIYENDHGLMQKGNSWFYTSSGYGGWGPPIRTGHRPELVVINLSGK